MKKENVEMFDNASECGWEFDFSTLPRWDNRDRIPYVWDKFYSLPESDALICIYSIAEVRMCWNQGFLAILKNKENPAIALNITEKINFTENFSVGKGGEVVFLQAHLYDKTTDTVNCPILIIDVVRERFSYMVVDNWNTCYKVIESEDGDFVIKADPVQAKSSERLSALDGLKIDLKRLTWYDFKELKKLPDMVFGSSAFKKIWNKIKNISP